MSPGKGETGQGGRRKSLPAHHPGGGWGPQKVSMKGFSAVTQ